MAPIKPWNCNNKCRSHCCSDIFIRLTPETKQRYLSFGCIFHNPKITIDWIWLAMHNGVEIKKHDNNPMAKIDKSLRQEIVANEHDGAEYLHIESRCKALLSDGKCKIYRARPWACKIAECVIDSPDPAIRFFARKFP